MPSGNVLAAAFIDLLFSPRRHIVRKRRQERYREGKMRRVEKGTGKKRMWREGKMGRMKERGSEAGREKGNRHAEREKQIKKEENRGTNKQNSNVASE